MVTNNNETLALLQQKGIAESKDAARLQAENGYLTSLLPQTLGVAEITVRRRWVRARLLLQQALGDNGIAL